MQKKKCQKSISKQPSRKEQNEVIKHREHIQRGCEDRSPYRARFIKLGLLGAVNFEGGSEQRVHTAVTEEEDAREEARTRGRR